MSRRTKIIITVIGIVIVIVIATLLLLWSRRQKDFSLEQVPTVGQERLSTVSNILPGETPPVVYTKKPSTQSILLAAALTFAERFGSYSNQAEVSGLQDLSALMTARMRKDAELEISRIRAARVEVSEYSGVTTKALKADIIALDEKETQAQVVVNTQRQESNGDFPQARIYYQKAALTLVKEQNSWKVDSLVWQ